MDSCRANPRDSSILTAQEPFGRVRVSSSEDGVIAPFDMEDAADL